MVEESGLNAQGLLREEVENKSGRDGQTFLNPQYARGIGVMKKTK
jgi:hypothetical protein